jgi:uncharacterized membrane protein YtjA (UPF0391 family)
MCFYRPTDYLRQYFLSYLSSFYYPFTRSNTLVLTPGLVHRGFSFFKRVFFPKSHKICFICRNFSAYKTFDWEQKIRDPGVFGLPTLVLLCVGGFAIVGFTGVSPQWAPYAQFLFFVFLLLFAISVIIRGTSPRKSSKRKSNARQIVPRSLKEE